MVSHSSFNGSFHITIKLEGKHDHFAADILLFYIVVQKIAYFSKLCYHTTYLVRRFVR